MATKESYEHNLNKLNDILENIQSDDLNLEESMKLYEQGVKLINKMYKILDSYNGKITSIVEGQEKRGLKKDDN
ncbi:exodeoxyribonuclease VII small subunit [Clostridium sp. BJN0001]|uniref:exodeoxyribonuclease VII small subunit n=1 Tax=Clostridium sp. BJN0001 TaxID=2930219 RepID=UPI001FD59B68|nr:exodeoxyribonuclease VII small subunit [Clostridium sp. BJN0001]